MKSASNNGNYKHMNKNHLLVIFFSDNIGINGTHVSAYTAICGRKKINLVLS